MGKFGMVMLLAAGTVPPKMIDWGAVGAIAGILSVVVVAAASVFNSGRMRELVAQLAGQVGRFERKMDEGDKNDGALAQTVAEQGATLVGHGARIAAIEAGQSAQVLRSDALFERLEARHDRQDVKLDNLAESINGLHRRRTGDAEG